MFFMSYVSAVQNIMILRKFAGFNTGFLLPASLLVSGTKSCLTPGPFLSSCIIKRIIFLKDEFPIYNLSFHFFIISLSFLSIATLFCQLSEQYKIRQVDGEIPTKSYFEHKEIILFFCFSHCISWFERCFSLIFFCASAFSFIQFSFHVTKESPFF
ncbi:unnamed protein product [Acanthosepion pharaonis]|uniref:Uncharacterized protein n=1 Tax=Acanthosepion pharaonis TaxID=158019 RepID=A0A812EE72_ACAPH|nr:unnamed protein product [Sepia pharaonis]